MATRSDSPGAGGNDEGTDFSDVDSTTILVNTDHEVTRKVRKEIIALRAKYYQLGIELGVPVDELEILRNQYGAVNIDQAFNGMVELWLKGRSTRTWQALVRAVASPAGGNNYALAWDIAHRHRAANTGRKREHSEDDGTNSHKSKRIKLDKLSSASSEASNKGQKVQFSGSLQPDQLVAWLSQELEGKGSTLDQPQKQKLIDEKIDGESFLDLKESDLKDMGFAKGDRIKIMKITQSLKLKGEVVEDNPAKKEPKAQAPRGIVARDCTIHPIIPPEIENMLQGNGRWHVDISSSKHMVEGVLEQKYVYKMTSYPRGLAIIINNRNFTSPSGYSERQGTDVDAASLTRLFMYLGFYTNRFDNLNGSDFRERLKEVARLDHSKYDCLIVAILTHGENGMLMSCDGDSIPISDIIHYFDGRNCPSLQSKPKVFVLQACRGGKRDFGVEVDGSDSADDKSPSEEMAKTLREKQIIEETLDEKEESILDDQTDDKDPTGKDFVIAYATLPGYVSWRSTENGSWFIKAFTDTMFEKATSDHLLDILIEVNRRVAEKFETKEKRNKQMPGPVMMLTRKLYIRPCIN